MIDVLLPGERDTLRDPATDLVDELTRLEVLSDDASLSDIGGVDLVVESQSVETRPTNVDDIVNVDITAAISGSIDGEALPIGDWIRDNLDEDLSELDTESPEPTTDTLPLTAVAQGRPLVPQPLLHRRRGGPGGDRRGHPRRGHRPDGRRQPGGGDGRLPRRRRGASTSAP